MDTEIERMVVRLMGDGSSYTRMIEAAQQATQQVAKVVEAAGARIEGISNSLKTFAGAAVGALSVLGLATSVKSAFDSFVGAENSVLRLSAAIRAGGGDAESVVEDYKQFAAAIGAVTMTTVPQTRAMLSQAEAFGLTGDMAKAAVKNAISLAAATGQSAEGMLRATVGLAEGNAQMLRRIPGLRGIRDESQLVAKAQELMGRGFQIAQEMTQSAGNQIIRLGNSLKGLSVEMGRLVAEFVLPAVKGLQYLVDEFKQLSPEVQKATTIVLTLGVAMASFKPVLNLLAPLFGSLRASLAVLGTIGGTIFSPWIVAITAVAGVVAVVIDKLGGFAGAWEAIKTGATDAWSWVKAKATDFVAWIVPAWNNLVPRLSEAWKGFTAAAGSAWDYIRDTAVSAWAVIREKAGQFVEWIKPIWAPLAFALTVVGSAGVAAFGLLSDAARATAGAVSDAFDLAVTTIQSVATATGEWVARNRTLVVSVGLVAASIGAVVLAVKAVQLAFAATMAVAAMLHVQQIASVAAWIAMWTTYGVVVATIVPILLTVKVATLLVSAAVATLSAMLIGGAIATSIVMVGALAAVFVTVGTAVYAAYTAVGAVVDVLAEATSLAGPIEQVGAMFAEWGGILKEVFDTAKGGDLGGAFDLLVKGGQLAVAQLKALMPPLWTLIGEGFSALWELVGSQFSLTFDRKFQDFKNKMARFSDVFGLIPKETQEDINALELSVKQAEDAMKGLAEAKLKAAGKKFAGSTIETEEVKKIRTEMDETRDKNAQTAFKDTWMESWLTDLQKGLGEGEKTAKSAKDVLATVGDGIGESMKKATHEVHRFDAALFGSADAMRRLQDYTDRLADSETKHAGAKKAATDAARSPDVETTKKVIEEVKKKTEEVEKPDTKTTEEVKKSVDAAFRPETKYGGDVIAAPGAEKATDEVKSLGEAIRDAERATLDLDRAWLALEVIRASGTGGRSDATSIAEAIQSQTFANRMLEEARKAKADADAAVVAKLPKAIDSETLKMPSVEEVAKAPPEALKMPSVEKPKVEYETDWMDEPEKAKRSIPILDDRNSFAKWRERQDARKAELAALPDDERDMWDFVGKQSDEVTKAAVPIRDDRNALVKFAEREAARKAAESDTFAFADEQQRMEEEDRRHQEEVDRAGGVYGPAVSRNDDTGGGASDSEKSEVLLAKMVELLSQIAGKPAIELQEVEIS